MERTAILSLFDEPRKKLFPGSGIFHPFISYVSGQNLILRANRLKVGEARMGQRQRPQGRTKFLIRSLHFGNLGRSPIRSDMEGFRSS